MKTEAFWITVLIIITVGIGYFFVTSGNKKVSNNTIDIPEEQRNINLDKVESADKEVPKNINNNQEVKYMYATLHTSMGDIKIEFNTDTPNTVANFTKLAESGFYDETKFHRVIKGFMNQGGDPLSKDDARKNEWGTGGPGYKFADEIGENNRNDLGTISMANAGPNTNGSQFFLNAADNNFLDAKHTVFGEVVSGLEVVKAINEVDTDANDRPLTPVVIESITLE